MLHQIITGTDSRDIAMFPIDFGIAHTTGKIHRAVHIEIIDSNNRILIWQRRDGRFEILGGHVNWNEKKSTPETYEEAAFHEISEELDLSHNLPIESSNLLSWIKSCLIPMAHFVNVPPTTRNNNYEWVVAFRLNWFTYEWGDPSSFHLGVEGNYNAKWLTIPEIEKLCLDNSTRINSALRHYLARNGILIPINYERRKEQDRG